MNSNRNNSWEREKQTNENPFHARLPRVLISESSLARQSLRGQLSRLPHTPRRQQEANLTNFLF